jgi:hypothetical protein
VRATQIPLKSLVIAVLREISHLATIFKNFSNSPLGHGQGQVEFIVLVSLMVKVMLRCPRVGLGTVNRNVATFRSVSTPPSNRFGSVSLLRMLIVVPLTVTVHGPLI